MLVDYEKDPANPRETITISTSFDLPHLPLRALPIPCAQALSEALQRKIFDEIGLMPGRPQVAPTVQAKSPDPILIGRILKRNKDARRNIPGSGAGLAFLIAWWINPEEI